MQFTPVLALYDPFGVDVPLNFDNTHSHSVGLHITINVRNYEKLKVEKCGEKVNLPFRLMKK